MRQQRRPTLLVPMTVTRYWLLDTPHPLQLREATIAATWRQPKTLVEKVTALDIHRIMNIRCGRAKRSTWKFYALKAVTAIIGARFVLRQ